MKTIILDLDGTLFNCEHRQHLAQAKQWDEFHSLATGDKPHEDVHWFVKLLCNSDFSQGMPKYHMVVLTGRNERYRKMTEDILRSNGLLIDALLMRPDDNYDFDDKMKIQLLEGYFGSKKEVLENVFLCLDDRDTVVEAFRNYGLHCWQVRQGAF